jgi:hypothetical protein
MELVWKRRLAFG